MGASNQRGVQLKFSLVLATIGRTEELVRFLKSLHDQSYTNFELIVIDQNTDDRLVPILNSFNKLFSIQRLYSEKGLSKARNVGLKHITGDIIAFPDDDCWYPPMLLEKVHNWFIVNTKISGLTGRSVDENGEMSMQRWSAESGNITKHNIWMRATSYTIFLRKNVIDSVTEFDERLGVGSGTPWGSAEEVDFLIRVLNKGYSIYYNNEIFAYHPNPVLEYNTKSIDRAYSYGRGMGRVLRSYHYSLFIIGYTMIRPLIGFVLSLLTCKIRKAHYHWAIFTGRFRGWLES